MAMHGKRMLGTAVGLLLVVEGVAQAAAPTAAPSSLVVVSDVTGDSNGLASAGASDVSTPVPVEGDKDLREVSVAVRNGQLEMHFGLVGTPSLTSAEGTFTYYLLDGQVQGCRFSLGVLLGDSASDRGSRVHAPFIDLESGCNGTPWFLDTRREWLSGIRDNELTGSIPLSALGARIAGFASGAWVANVSARVVSGDYEIVNAQNEKDEYVGVTVDSGAGRAFVVPCDVSQRECVA